MKKKQPPIYAKDVADVIGLTRKLANKGFGEVPEEGYVSLTDKTICSNDTTCVKRKAQRPVIPGNKKWRDCLSKDYECKHISQYVS